MLNSTCLAVLSVSLLLSFCNIHCFKCQIEVYSKYKHPKPMQGATPGPRFCALHRHSSRPPWGMCVHTSSGVSVGAPFICSWTNCVPSCGSLIPLRSTGILQDSFSLPFLALFFFFSAQRLMHRFPLPRPSIPSVKMLPRSTQHPQLPAELLHLEVRPAQSQHVQN